ncbi:MAG: LysR family transcriptional regulator [Synechococcaceae cyanobacterium SM2_3_1]|nr:LysR family transcriptional regulator [Synechococcaceae cyanobacterium SM2_3_1]
MKLEDITLNHIRILKVVHDCQSFSKAATELGYSQGLISKKVKQLEDYFGTRLLKRSPGLVCLTNKGERLITKFCGLYEDVEALHQEFQTSGLDLTRHELVVGTTSLLSAVWFDQYLHRFRMCFPERQIRWQVVDTDQFARLSQDEFDFLVNTSSAYQSQHCCNRLQTYRLFWVDLSSKVPVSQAQVNSDGIRLRCIPFNQLILLEEIWNDLSRGGIEELDLLSQAIVVNGYQDLLQRLVNEKKSTILPGFCLTVLQQHYNLQATAILDAGKYGIHIHVPSHSELLILAESLVRSFQLEQDHLETLPQLPVSMRSQKPEGQQGNPVRIGLQRDSIGQVIAGNGVAYIADQLRLSPPEFAIFPDTGIDHDFELQVNLFASSDLITRQMQQDELDIAILDDIALLRNGSNFFDNLNFGSKLIGIASYNISGRDISILVPRNSEINSIKDLKNKQVSVLFGSNSHRFLITVFDSYGYDIEKDCTLINEDSRTASSSLVNESIDAHVCCQAFAAQLEKHRFGRRLDLAKDQNIRLPSLRGIVCRSQFIREHPQAVITYLYHLILANYWFLSNPMQSARKLAQLANFNPAMILSYFDADSGNRIDPTLKPQWSWLLKTLNRRLEGHAGIAKFDVDFWIDDYFLRLTYSLLGIDYHFQQVSFANEFSNSYFADEKFSKYMEFLASRQRRCS